MVFSSNIFLFLFLPVYLGIYYLTPFKWRSLIILLGSYIFYAWWRVDFLFLLIGVTLWNHWSAKLILKCEGQDWGLRWMQIGVIGNLATLGLFKYFNFGVDSLNILLEQSGMNSIEALRFILPIGISFYIFQSISFLVDVYRKDTPPPKHFLDYAAFISLFPQLIAGPVLRYKDLADQFEKREHSFALFSQGAYRFMVGFAKKVLIADSVSSLVDTTYALDNPTMAESWLGAIAYTVQLYFDFSGYSDMAIGLGLMMGFRFMENFNLPYISKSITEFWRRWHISLSTWLKDYLYIPLGGNRDGTIKTYRNLLLTMVLGGLWHGANWTFVIWGAWHGAILALERATGIKPGLILTFLFVVIGWVMFRAETVEQALMFYEGMIGLNGIGITDRLNWQITGVSLTALAAGLGLSFFGGAFKDDMRSSISMQTAVILAFILAVIKLSAQSYSPFLYFQF